MDFLLTTKIKCVFERLIVILEQTPKAANKKTIRLHFSLSRNMETTRLPMGTKAR